MGRLLQEGRPQDLDDVRRGRRGSALLRLDRWPGAAHQRRGRRTALHAAPQDVRLHPAGRRAFEERDRRKDASYSYERPPRELPPDWLARFEADAAAWTYWQRETPSYRRTATHWVLSAKRPETRERRFATLVADSAAGRRVKPFLVRRDD
jgi:hypothetical protein